VHDVESDLKNKINAAAPAKGQPVGHVAAPAPSTESAPAGEQAPAPDRDSDDEAGHGSDESLLDSGNGTFVTPEPDQKMLENLKRDAPPPKPKEKPRTYIDKEPAILNFNYDMLKLSGGGESVDKASNGYIANGATLLQKSGPGFIRVSSDDRAYGTGYSVSFIKEAAANFDLAHHECGKLAIGDLSFKSGGTLIFKGKVNGQSAAKSHRNGLDLDIAYLPNSNLSLVVHNHKVDANFNVKCNYDWFKYVTNLTLPNSDDSFVHFIFVNAAIKSAICKYQKENNLYSPEDMQTQSALSKWDAHGDHHHIRLRCSPKHSQCQNSDNLPPVRTKCD
jgi:murein endopeptidase